MDRHKLTDLNAYYEAFRKSMVGSAWKEEPQRFEMDWLSECVSLVNEIKAGTYTTSKGSEFTLRERGRTRRVHGSRMRDRVVRHVLCDEITDPSIKPYLIHNNGASQKGKGLSFAREMFERDLHNYWLKYRTNEGYIAFIDFSKFYDNIRHDKIREALYPKLDGLSQWVTDIILKYFEVDVSYMSDEEYAHCIEEKHDSVAYYKTVPDHLRTGTKMMPKGVDIGDQVSQSIGVFFPTPIDNYVKIVRGCKWYGRYMDDMYIICEDKDELKSIVEGVKEKAAELGLFVNDKKTRIVKLGDKFKYLQIRYSLSASGKVIRRINPNGVTRERRKLKAYKRLLGEGKVPYETIEQAARSWMGSHSRIMSKAQIQHMKDLYKELFGKELNWKPGRK